MKTDNTLKIQIGNRIREAREATGITQEKLASALELSVNHISDIDLYKKVVAFYFPKATVEFQMKIVTRQASSLEPSSAVILNLFDMM